MGAIDLLFDLNLSLERLHQLALGSLLPETNVLKHMGIEAKPDTKGVDWEPARRLFDLAVKLNDGRRAWVEIKIDSDLGEAQRNSQFTFVFGQPEREGDHLIYLLLGACQHFHDAAALEAELKDRKGGRSGLVKVVTARALKAILERPDILPDHSTPARDLRDLIAAYADALFRLDDRFQRFAKKSIKEWKASDYIGVFACCREKIPSMQGAEIGYAPFPGDFHYCAWGGKPLDCGAPLYLSFENGALRFKAFFGKEMGGPERGFAMWPSIREALAREAQSAGIKLDAARPKKGKGEAITMTVGTVGSSPFGEEKDWQGLPNVRSVVAQAEAVLARVARIAIG